eukprot:363901-Chlamydomonas_euryale.AAC.35
MQRTASQSIAKESMRTPCCTGAGLWPSGMGAVRQRAARVAAQADHSGEDSKSAQQVSGLRDDVVYYRLAYYRLAANMKHIFDNWLL